MLLNCFCLRRSYSTDLPNFEIINGPRTSRPRLKRMEPYVQSMSVNGASTTAQYPRCRSMNRSSSPDSTLGRQTSAWERFPSYGREERCFSPAGRADNIYAHDFAADFPRITETVFDRKKRKLSLAKAKKRTQGRGPIKDVVDGISRCYLLGFRGVERGHRSSISAGGVLEYPELELLPSIGLFPPSPHISQQSENMESSRFDRAASIFCRTAAPFHAPSSRSLRASHSVSDESARTIITRPRIVRSSSHLSCLVAKPAVASVSRVSV